MGIDRNLWLGAYLKIEKTIQFTRIEAIVKAACECKAEIERDTKFCPKCGKPTEITVKNEQVDMDLLDLLEEINSENLSPAQDLPILLPNKKTKYGHLLDVGYGGAKYGAFIEPEKAIEEFKSSYKKELTELDKLGVEYEINVGFVFFYS